jgi:hypothetical protein
MTNGPRQLVWRRPHRDSQRPRRSAASPQNRNPGDEAAPRIIGTGEDICPQCRGSGKINGARCATAVAPERLRKELAALELLNFHPRARADRVVA